MISVGSAPCRCACVASLVLLTLPSVLIAQSLREELEGLSRDPRFLLDPDPDAHQLAGDMLPMTGLLLIPESTNDRVMAFDPMTGDLVDADFIPADPTNLSTPIEAILSADGASVLVSDQGDDVVQQYDLAGNYIGIFAPAGGVDTSILNNVRGIALRPNGNLLVTVASGVNAHAIAEFDIAGNYLGNFVANGAAGMSSPFDVYEVVFSGGSLAAGEFLVPTSNSEAVHRYDANGGPLADLAPIDNFGEQVLQITNGNVLVGIFLGAQEGVLELDSSGAVVGVYNPVPLGGNCRGVYELPNGNILTTNGTGVHEIGRSGVLVETKISGVNARFISFVGGQEPQTPVVEIPTLGAVGAGLLAMLLLITGFMSLRRRA